MESFDIRALNEQIERQSAFVTNLQAGMAQVIVGQKHLVESLLIGLLSDGHVLLEGVPGLAKTQAIKTLASLVDAQFSRIQFTPDLLPADVIGTMIYSQKEEAFQVEKGPVFANFVLADEINRAPAKVQSALLEAMQERQVTIGKETFQLPKPFLVLATQNPIEQEGTYNLPEAELDRFLLKLIVPYPTPEEEIQIVKSEGRASDIAVNRVFSSSSLEKCRNAVDAVTVDDKMLAYIVSIVNVTRADTNHHDEKKISLSASNHRSDIQKYISFGASPRAGIALLRCAKVHALFENRSFVLAEDIQAVAKPVLRHRLVLNYEAAADSVTADDLISKIIDFMPVP